jgi:hypothetical protein
MRHLIIVSIAIGSIGLMACDSRITGNEGNFVFSYTADDDVRNFNKPVAVGAFLDMEVRNVGSEQPVELSAAAFDDETILMVTDFSGHELTIQGVASGGALLEVTGTQTDGEELSDSVNMLARVPDQLVLRHTCLGAEARAGNYLTDQRVWMPFDMLENDRAVIGYGYYPIDITGDAATLDAAESNQQYMAFDTAATAGAVTFDSQVDDETLTLNVVTPGDIDGVMQPIAFVGEDIDVGDVNAFYTLPSVGGVAVCQAAVDIDVASDTETICDVRKRNEPDNGDEDARRERGWFEVEGLAEGTCQYTVTYPDGNGGAGASAQFTYEIQP